MEHTRHTFLKISGLDFAELHRRGLDVVMVRCELDYWYPLRSGSNECRFELSR